jgi:hypothetical protein
MRRILMIYDPTAGRDASARLSLAVCETTAAGDAEALARAVDPNNF